MFIATLAISVALLSKHTRSSVPVCDIVAFSVDGLLLVTRNQSESSMGGTLLETTERDSCIRAEVARFKT